MKEQVRRRTGKELNKKPKGLTMSRSNKETLISNSNVRTLQIASFSKNLCASVKFNFSPKSQLENKS